LVVAILDAHGGSRQQALSVVIARRVPMGEDKPAGEVPQLATPGFDPVPAEISGNAARLPLAVGGTAGPAGFDLKTPLAVSGDVDKGRLGLSDQALDDEASNAARTSAPQHKHRSAEDLDSAQAAPAAANGEAAPGAAGAAGSTRLAELLGRLWTAESQHAPPADPQTGDASGVPVEAWEEWVLQVTQPRQVAGLALTIGVVLSATRGARPLGVAAWRDLDLLPLVERRDP
jgi:hypothetical protein